MRPLVGTPKPSILLQVKGFRIQNALRFRRSSASCPNVPERRDDQRDGPTHHWPQERILAEKAEAWRSQRADDDGVPAQQSAATIAPRAPALSAMRRLRDAEAEKSSAVRIYLARIGASAPASESNRSDQTFFTFSASSLLRSFA